MPKPKTPFGKSRRPNLVWRSSRRWWHSTKKSSQKHVAHLSAACTDNWCVIVADESDHHKTCSQDSKNCNKHWYDCPSRVPFEFDDWNGGCNQCDYGLGAARRDTTHNWIHWLGSGSLRIAHNASSKVHPSQSSSFHPSGKAHYTPRLEAWGHLSASAWHPPARITKVLSITETRGALLYYRGQLGPMSRSHSDCSLRPVENWSPNWAWFLPSFFFLNFLSVTWWSLGSLPLSP